MQIASEGNIKAYFLKKKKKFFQKFFPRVLNVTLFEIDELAKFFTGLACMFTIYYYIGTVLTAFITVEC